MRVWYYLVTNEDGTKYEDGPHPSEDAADGARSLVEEEHPELVVGPVTEHQDDYVPIAPTAQVVKADGSVDVIYNDGSVVNIPAS